MIVKILLLHDTQASYIIPKFITMTLTPISEEKAFCLSQA